MAIQWLLTRKNVCSVLIGASNQNQISNCAEAVKKPPLSDAELKRIDDIALKRVDHVLDAAKVVSLSQNPALERPAARI
ncbi:MAG: aldo/keto reductase [Bacilli bacterium]